MSQINKENKIYLPWPLHIETIDRDIIAAFIDGSPRNTYKIKDYLKELGFKWHDGKGKWWTDEIDEVTGNALLRFVKEYVEQHKEIGWFSKFYREWATINRDNINDFEKLVNLAVIVVGIDRAIRTISALKKLSEEEKMQIIKHLENEYRKYYRELMEIAEKFFRKS